MIPTPAAFWAQVMAVASKYNYTGIRTLRIDEPEDRRQTRRLPSTSLDTARFARSTSPTVGAMRGPLAVSGTAVRLFGLAGRPSPSPIGARELLSCHAERLGVRAKERASIRRATATSRRRSRRCRSCALLGGVGPIVGRPRADSRSFIATYAARARSALRVHEPLVARRSHSARQRASRAAARLRHAVRRQRAGSRRRRDSRRRFAARSGG